jgi:hypothetical protein
MSASNDRLNELQSQLSSKTGETNQLYIMYSQLQIENIGHKGMISEITSDYEAQKLRST